MKRSLPLTELWQEHDQLRERLDATVTLIDSLRADFEMTSRRMESVRREIELLRAQGGKR